MSTGDAELGFHTTDQLHNCIQRKRHRAEEVWTPVKLAAMAKIAHERYEERKKERPKQTKFFCYCAGDRKQMAAAFARVTGARVEGFKALALALPSGK